MKLKIEDVIINRSRGLAANGKIVYYIRPSFECFNRSRKISGYDFDIKNKITEAILKYYTPLKKYSVNGRTIGSNNG